MLSLCAVYHKLFDQGEIVMKKKIITIVQVIIGAALLLGLFNIVYVFLDYRTGESSYDELAALAVIPEAVIPETTTQSILTEKTESIPEETLETVETIQEEMDDTVWPVIDFAALQQINPDIIGWIYIEDTKINYPITYSGDNDYYLNHLYDGTSNSAGCIFLDKECAKDFSMPNSVIYGHNMGNGTMFRGILNYKTQEFYNEHPIGLLITPNAKYKIEFFSAYVANATLGSSLHNAWDLNFTEDGYVEWLKQISERSLFQSEAVPQNEDRVLTLSTCTYDFENARFVLHGILREQIDQPNT